MKNKKLGEMLLEERIITQEQLMEALDIQRKKGLKLGEVLEEQGFINEDKIINVLQNQLGIEFVDIDRIQIEEDILKLIPEDMAKKYNVIPLNINNAKMTLAMRDPVDYFALEDIRRHVGLKIIPVISYRTKLDNAIKKYYGKSIVEKAIDDFIKQNNITVKNKDISLNIQNDSNAPIMVLINTIIENAVHNRASDIHIEPGEQDLRIRYRVDGILVETMRIQVELSDSIISRIKIMCDMDITERRIPQDGRSVFIIDNKKIDLRVSILPIADGEKVVIRILDKSNFSFNKNLLGFSNHEMDSYNSMLKKPHGIVLITGPTGSGKTTTLYTMLSELNSTSKNIVTIEDPVEYKFKGINQVHVNAKANLTFASALRSVLRQDPDIIMLGEIRDNETAQIAFRAALTGHLVLATLHTNDSLGTITRLVDMGIEPFLISSTLLGVVSQRLIRKICPYCKTAYVANSNEKKVLNYVEDNELILHKGEGCSYCNHTGYKDRMAVFEMLEIDKDYKNSIEEYTNHSSLENISLIKNFKRLRDNGARKVIEGITTIDELMKLMYL